MRSWDSCFLKNKGFENTESRDAVSVLKNAAEKEREPFRSAFIPFEMIRTPERDSGIGN
jgi:hypothetical protein